MSISELSTLAGLLSLGITLFVTIIGAVYVVRSNVGKQTSDAQGSAISAMQAEIAVLDKKLEDVKEEKRLLERMLETLIDTFKSREIYITIQGHQIIIKEGKETIITRISDDPGG